MHKIFNLGKKLFPICRSLTGKGVRQTLNMIKEFEPSLKVKSIKSGKKVLICAHGNSLRALVKHLDGINEEDITNLNIPTGIPLVYELNDDLTPITNYYLGDPEAAKKAAESVANQAKGK